MIRIGILLIFLACISKTAQSQGSLEDTTIISQLLHEGQDIYLSEPDLAMEKWQLALTKTNNILKNRLVKSEKKVVLLLKSDLLFNLSQLYRDKGNTSKTIDFLQQALSIDEALDNKQNMSSSYNDLGIIYNDIGLFDEALEHYMKSLKIDKELGNHQGVAASLVNLGFLHAELENHTEAISFFKQSLAIQIENKDTLGMITSHNNLASMYIEIEAYEASIKEARLGLHLSETAQDVSSMANSMSKIGLYFRCVHQTDSALIYLNKSLVLREKTEEQSGQFSSYIELSRLFEEENNMSIAVLYGEKAYNIARQSNFPKQISVSSDLLSGLYAKQKKYKQAFLMQSRFLLVEKTLKENDHSKILFKKQFEEEYRYKRNQDSLIQLQVNLERQAETDKIQFEKKQAAQAQADQDRNNKNYLIFSIIGFGLLSTIILIVFKNNSNKQKANHTMAEQKLVLEKKNKEIVDSIRYAKRLQNATLPPINAFEGIFADHFLMYLPKDIVAGDFYWTERISADIIYLAVADSTGHGVPGAMVSVVCSNALSKATVEEGIQSPSAILDRCKQLVIEKFSGDENNLVRDGMDISLCRFDFKNQELQWAGANNPLWKIKHGSSQIDITKGDSQSIGHSINTKPFTNHVIPFSKGDQFYLFSDGYVDQFGGTERPGGEKYKVKKMLNLVKLHHSSPGNVQKKELLNAHKQWKGSLDQIDDICIMGMTI